MCIECQRGPTFTASNSGLKNFARADGAMIECIVLATDCVTLVPLLTEGNNLPAKTFDYQGRKVPGSSVEFEPKSEPWAQYTLADGTQVKVKVILLDCARLENEYNQQNDPVYVFQFQQIIGTVVPDHLKRKAQ
jgi:hypothetical protein